MATTRKPTDERKVEIASAALKIISSRGVHRLTAKELANEVGIADGTIFRHFPDKKAIVRAAIERLESLLFEDEAPSEPDPLDRLGAFVVRRLRLVHQLPHVFLAAFSDRLLEAAEGDAPLVHSVVERSQRFVRECLAEAQRKGLVGRALPVDVLTTIVIGTLQSSAFQLHRGRRAKASPEQTWEVLETLLRSTARR